MIVGEVYIIDGFPHKLIEDNGNRGFFEVCIPNFTIKPILLIHYKDLQ